MKQGYVKLYRQIMENPLYFEEPFSRAQAWIDILLLANHKTTYFLKRGVKVNVNRGQLGRSIVELADRWKWGRTKTKNFLKLLESEQQIIIENIGVTTLLTVINYEDYQGNDNETCSKRAANVQQTNTKRAANVQQTSTYNNVKNDNNEKNVKVTANKSRPKNTKYIDEIIEDFKNVYYDANNFEYVVTNKGKERAAVGRILREYKNKNPDNTSEMTRDGLKKYFEMCVNIPDMWMRQNMSLSLINSKFNEINNILRNGNKTSNKRGATDAELASVISKHFATDYKP